MIDTLSGTSGQTPVDMRRLLKSRRKVSLATMLLAAELFVGCLLASHALWFVWTIDQGDTSPKPLAAAMVFTGDHERVRVGLKLAETGQARVIFISGANAEAGIWMDRFAAQFGDGRADFDALLKCCVDFGPQAETTLQNGLESACWLRMKDIQGPIGLVTSSVHMPRALFILRHFAPHRQIYPIPIPHIDDPDDLRRIATEYFKYLTTKIILLAPGPLSDQLTGDFAQGCTTRPAAAL